MNTLFIPIFLSSFIMMVSTVFAQNTPTINTPLSLVQCQPSLLTWTGGVPPYFFVLLQGTTTALVNLGEQNGTSLTWIVNATEGSSVFLQLRDSTGFVAQSGDSTVQTSSDSSCINGSAITGTPATSAPTGTTAASGSASGTSTSTSASGASAAGTTGGSTAKASQGASSTSTGATTHSSSAAVASHFAPVGTMVMTGAAALAFAFML